MDIDFSYFNEVTFGDKMLMLEFIDIFEKQIPEIVNDLKNALNEKNYKKTLLSKIFSKVKNFFIKKVYKIITKRTTVRRGTIKDII